MPQKRILIIDNNRVLLQLMVSFFEKQDHVVRTAEDAFTALDVIKNFTPNIIYVDLIMPKISGDIQQYSYRHQW